MNERWEREDRDEGGKRRAKTRHQENRFSCLKPGLDWTRLFMSLTAGAGTRCMSLLSSSPSLQGAGEENPKAKKEIWESREMS